MIPSPKLLDQIDASTLTAGQKKTLRSLLTVPNRRITQRQIYYRDLLLSWVKQEQEDYTITCKPHL